MVLFWVPFVIASMVRPTAAFMDDNGGLDMRNWAYNVQPLKRNLGLQLMSSVAGRNASPRQWGASSTVTAPMEFSGDCWMGYRESKMVHMMPLNPNQSVLPDGHGAQALPMLQPPEPPKYDKIPLMDDAGSRKEAPLKRKAQANKAPKPRKPKKVAATRNEMANGSVSRGVNVRKSLDVVIIGIHLDISELWLGVGGWHSACCTTSISMCPQRVLQGER